MSLSIKIKEYELVGEHIEFIIEVYDKVTGDSWKFQRRYSALRDAHKQLKSLDNRIPEFPPKKIFGSKNPKFLEQRRSELETYFNTIVKMPRLMENSFTKEMLRQSDSVVSKSTPVQSTTPYKKHKHGPEMQNFVDKLNDVVSSKFFDLSAQPAPPDEEDITRQRKAFESLLKNIKVGEGIKLIEGSHINDAYHKTTVVRHIWANSAFTDLIRIVNDSNTVELLISFK